MDKLETRLGKANEAMQKNLDRGEQQIAASYGLVGSILLAGLVGYLLDRWLGTSPGFVISGLFVGIAFGLYLVARSLRRPDDGM